MAVLIFFAAPARARVVSADFFGGMELLDFGGGRLGASGIVAPFHRLTVRVESKSRLQHRASSSIVRDGADGAHGASAFVRSFRGKA